jgi:hypothetical protein
MKINFEAVSNKTNSNRKVLRVIIVFSLVGYSKKANPGKNLKISQTWRVCHFE